MLHCDCVSANNGIVFPSSVAEVLLLKTVNNNLVPKKFQQ